jgi:hypothetical protein
MAKYKLNNRVLQGHLDVISGGEFSEVLRSGIEFDKDGFVVVTFGSSKHDNNKALITGKFTVTLHKSEVIKLAEYDPTKWNRYPEVTPPENEWMRVEQWSNNRCRLIGGIFRNGKWYCKQDVGGQYLETTLDNVDQFRPWE